MFNVPLATGIPALPASNEIAYVPTGSDEGTVAENLPFTTCAVSEYDMSGFTVEPILTCTKVVF